MTPWRPCDVSGFLLYIAHAREAHLFSELILILIIYYYISCSNTLSSYMIISTDSVSGLWISFRNIFTVTETSWGWFNMNMLSHQYRSPIINIRRSHPLMMTWSNGNIFRFIGPLWGKSTGDRWIPLTKASDAELWYLLFCALTNKQSKRRWFETPSRSLWRHCNVIFIMKIFIPGKRVFILKQGPVAKPYCSKGNLKTQKFKTPHIDNCKIYPCQRTLAVKLKLGFGNRVYVVTDIFHSISWFHQLAGYPNRTACRQPVLYPEWSLSSGYSQRPPVYYACLPLG